MGVRVKLFYPHMQQHAGGKETVEVNGGTIGECLRNLVTLYPDVRGDIFASDGNLFRFVAIHLNGQSTYHAPDPLAIPVNDGDELGVVLLIAGG